MIDQNWIKSNDAWFSAQQNLIDQLELDNEYTLKEIELHKRAVELNSQMIEHYKKGIIDQRKVVEDYINENKD